MASDIIHVVALLPPPDRALLHAKLAVAEDSLAKADLRLARMQARHRAIRLNPAGSAAAIWATEYVRAQWQHRRRMLLDQLWPAPG